MTIQYSTLRRRFVRAAKLALSFSFLYMLFALPLVRTEEPQPLSGGIFTPELTTETDVFDNGEPLNIDQVTRLALERNLDIGMLQFQNKSESYETTIANSIYDSKMSLYGRYTQDNQQTAIPVFGDRQISGVAGASVQRYLPTGTFVKLDGYTERYSTNSAFYNPQRFYDSHASVEVSQSLFRNAFGYLDRKRIERVRLNVKQFDYQTLDGIEDLLYRIRLAYWDLKFAFEELRANLRALRKAQDFFQITRDKLDVGLAERPDVYAAEANVRRRVLEALEAQNEVKAQSENLRILLNLPDVPLIYPSEDLGYNPPSIDVAKTLEEAYASRRDLKQMETALESQKIERKIRSRDRLPEVSFDGKYTSNGLDRSMANSQGEVFGFNHPTYFAGFRLDANIENREAGGRFHQADFEYRRLEKDVEKLRLTIKKQVEDSYRDLQLAGERVKQTKTITELQQKKLAEEERNFTRGRSNSKTIIDYQDDLIRAQTSAIQALMLYNKALETFYRVTNGLIDRAGVAADTMPPVRKGS